MRMRRATLTEKIALDMTPMIDAVFQLLVFFILTLKIVAPEGDFNVSLPATASADVAESAEPPLRRMRLSADAGGELAEILLDGRSYGRDWDAVRRELVRWAGAHGGPDSFRARAEVEIDAPYDLRYVHVIHGLNYVTGEVVDGRVVTLIERVRFMPRGAPPSGS